MAKIIDNLKEQLVENILTETEIDAVMEKEKYYPIESDTDQEEGILKYSNGKSQIWIKYIYSDGEYLVTDITMKTKKSGSTKSRHLTIEEIKKLMDYFRSNKKYDEFMIFIMELFLARRIGDTLSLEWSHFYYENGNKRETVSDLVEEKTEIEKKGIDWDEILAEFGILTYSQSLEIKGNLIYELGEEQIVDISSQI